MFPTQRPLFLLHTHQLQPRPPRLRSLTSCICGMRRPLTTNATNAKPPGKFKTFMKKYGYVGAGVYTVLSVIDLSLTMAIISVKGADRVKQAEDYVLHHLKGLVGIDHKSEEQQHTTDTDHPSLTTIFLAAYGIHKTLLLPVRVSLTAAITPAVARSIRRLTSK